MKIALCLSGYFNSLIDKTSLGIDGYNHIQKYILCNNDVDIFIHSWDVNNSKVINNIYSLFIKDQHFEIQKDFNNEFLSNKLNTIKLHKSYVHPTIIFSHFYSVQASHELMRKYEIKHNFEYDIVIKSRFDLGRINRNTSGPGKSNPYPVQCINFNTHLDMNKFYMANWQYLDSEGPADMWFYSNSINMRNFTQLYNIIKTDLTLDSDYSKTVPTQEQLCNTIRLYKWFMIKTKLWDKKQTLETHWE